MIAKLVDTVHTIIPFTWLAFLSSLRIRLVGWTLATSLSLNVVFVIRLLALRNTKL